MAARNRVTIEGTLKRTPKAWKLTDGRKRAIFTIRTQRDNGKHDYIDCCAYGETAESMEYIPPGRTIEVQGWLMTFKRPDMEYKRTSLIVERWVYTGPIEPAGE
jgi:single-stranded DNA-binding protein